jgi:glycosyltransferase involved in cell wall biosynthesis
LPLRVLILPSHDYWDAWTGCAPSGTEDRELPFRLMAAHGISYRRINIRGSLANPFSWAPPLFRAIDPVRALQVLFFERKADVVLCYFESAALVLVLLRRLLGFKGKIVVRDVGVAAGWRLRRRILDIVVPRADALLPLGTNQADALLGRWHPRGLVEAFPMAIDCDFFGPAPDHPDGPVLAIGDDVSRDYATLLAVAEDVPATIAIRTRVLQQVKRSQRNVLVLPEFLPYAAFRDKIGASLIVVLPLHPSTHAGGVSALLQAMAMGKAVVVSASPGIMDYVRHNETCLVVPCHDQLALLAAIRRLLKDAALRMRLGNAARQVMLSRHSLPVQAAWLETVFRRLTEEGPGMAGLD